MPRFILLIPLYLFISGCAYLQSLGSGLPQRVDHWIEQQEYGKALETLEYVDNKHPNFAQLNQQKKRILKLAKQYEAQVESKANQLEKNNKWNQANIQYEKALEKLPKGSQLQTKHQSFLNRRASYLENLEFQLDISRGAWLIDNLPLQKRIYLSDPEVSSASDRYQASVEEKHNVIEGLIKCSITTIKNNRPAMAKTCFQIAQSLNDIEREDKQNYDSELASIEKQITGKQSIITRKLINELKQGYSHENLKRAKQHLVSIHSSKNNRDKLTRELNRIFKAGVAQRMEAGRKLYSNGKIKQALAIWEPLATIVPENVKLKSHIARSKRVLANLQKLKQQQPAR